MKVSKWVSLVACAVLLLGMVAGCNTSPADKSANDAQAEGKQPEQRAFKRLESVTITDNEGVSNTYTVTWNGENCAFEYMLERDEKITIHTSFTDNVFSLNFDEKDVGEDAYFENATFPVCKFDADERVVLIYNEDDITETIEIRYDENGWPVLLTDYLDDAVYDTEKRQMTYKAGGFGGEGPDGERVSGFTYEIRTFDEKGNVISVDQRTVTTYGDGRTEEELEEDTEKWAYDADGNVISYQDKYATVTFTYTDEVIHHTWERMMPLTYVNMFLYYDYPLFWNIQ